MNDRAGFLASVSDSLVSVCVWWLAAATMILAERGFALGLLWPLLAVVLAALVFDRLLRRGQSVALLTAVTLLLFGGFLAAFILLSAVRMTVLHVFVLAVGAGMAVGLPLYLALHRPSVHSHLTHLDVLLLAYVWLLLCRSAMGLGEETPLLFLAVALLSAGAAVGLRMSGGGRDSVRAMLAALGAALLTALLVFALVSLFSHSGELTGSVLRVIGAFFSRLGALLTAFFTWLASWIGHDDRFDALELEEQLPSVAGAETVEQMKLAVDGYGLLWVCGALLLAAAVFLALRFRRRKLRLGGGGPASPAPARSSRITGALRRRWQALLAALRFRWTAFRRRNTPAGLLAWLERRSRRRGRPRRPGESMRHFLAELDRDGVLAPLADALDLLCYGSRQPGLSPAVCRAIRRAYRAALSHERSPLWSKQPSSSAAEAPTSRP